MTELVDLVAAPPIEGHELTSTDSALRAAQAGWKKSASDLHNVLPTDALQGLQVGARDHFWPGLQPGLSGQIVGSAFGSCLAGLDAAGTIQKAAWHTAGVFTCRRSTLSSRFMTRTCRGAALGGPSVLSQYRTYRRGSPKGHVPAGHKHAVTERHQDPHRAATKKKCLLEPDVAAPNGRAVVPRL
jgi:hypothetical protein